ncbi:MAG: tetratricopeptide repeat protein [Pirellulales bacterium]|nr:tetratricopeptide repeat protein [Pirellulales bacterium]
MTPPKLHWSAYLWPGLPHVWTRGSWAGLGLAVGFTALGNLLAVATLVWTEWLPERVRAGGWLLLGVVWLAAWLDARADWRRYLAEWASGEGGDPRQRADRLYREALGHYLAGDHVAAEQTVQKILKIDRRDPEARLLTATLLRRTGRTDEAFQHLAELERLETAAPWHAEIAAERRLLTITVSQLATNLPRRGKDETQAESDDATAHDRNDATTLTIHARDERPDTKADPAARNRAA